MLVYIIDGYNLLHKIPVLKNSITPCRDLIRYIKKDKLTGSKNNKVIVVFDGSTPDNLMESDFEVIFSYDKSADEIIKKKIEKFEIKSQVVVVSDDREIRDAAKRARAVSLRTFEFIKTRVKTQKSEKEISYSLQREITEELRRIWLK